MKKVIFKRIRGRIIPIIQKVVGQRKPNARKILRATASARTNLANKRIGAIKAVRKAKFKRKQAKSIIHLLERKEMAASKIRGANQRKMDSIVNKIEAKISSGKQFKKKMRKNEMINKGDGNWGYADMPDHKWNKEQIKRVMRNRAYTQAQKTPEYKRLDAINSKMNKVYNRNQNIMSTIENKGMPSGATAKTTMLKNKVVKTDNDLHGMIRHGQHIGVASRAKLSILLNKKKITPETFLVQTSKKDYKVSERINTPRFSETERRDRSIYNFTKKIRRQGIEPLDMHFENLGKAGRDFKIIDTGQFDVIPALKSYDKNLLSKKTDKFEELFNKKSSLKRLNKFTIKSKKLKGKSSSYLRRRYERQL